MKVVSQDGRQRVFDAGPAAAPAGAVKLVVGMLTLGRASVCIGGSAPLLRHRVAGKKRLTQEDAVGFVLVR